MIKWRTNGYGAPGRPRQFLFDDLNWDAFEEATNDALGVPTAGTCERINVPKIEANALKCFGVALEIILNGVEFDFSPRPAEKGVPPYSSSSLNATCWWASLGAACNQ